MSARIAVVARSFTEASAYIAAREREFPGFKDESRVVMDELTLFGTLGLEVHLVGDYEDAPGWIHIARELDLRRAKVTVIGDWLDHTEGTV